MFRFVTGLFCFGLVYLSGISDGCAQTLENFTQLEAADPVPADFTTAAKAKFEQDRATIDPALTWLEKEEQENFYLETNYWLNELLLSGRVLFNDPVSEYVGDVADKILKDDPDLRSQLRFYAIKSPYVNAFATNQGMIFVNIGLISQLENEAQLAFVLCHEIVHYKEEHVLNTYRESRRIREGRGVYSRKNSYEKILAKSAFSKSQELEADKEGLEMFLKTDYDPAALEGVFDVLQFAGLPFDIVPFDKSVFETAHLTFAAEEFLLEEVDELDLDTHEDDPTSTHPAIGERRDQIAADLDGATSEGKVLFQFSQARFEGVRNLARFEMSRLYLLNQEYGKALYHTYLLLRNFPDNKYLRTNMALALTNLAMYRNEGESSEIIEHYSDIQGEPQQLYYFLYQLEKDQIAELAVREAWQLYLDFPEDEVARQLAWASLYELVAENEMRPRHYATKPPQAVIEKADTTSNEKLSKYDKLRAARAKESTNDEGLRMGFIELFKHAKFADAFQRTVEDVKADAAAEAVADDDVNSRQNQRGKGSEFPDKPRDLQRVVLVDPMYLSIDSRKSLKVDYRQSMDGKEQLVQLLPKKTEGAGMESEMVDQSTLGFDEADRYNDLAYLGSWLDERLFHQDNEVERAITIGPQRGESLAKKYDTEFFAWVGAIETIEKYDRNLVTQCCVSSVVMPPLIPIAIYYAVANRRRNYFFTFLMNVKTGEEYWFHFSKTNGKLDQGTLSSEVGSIMRQLKKSE